MKAPPWSRTVGLTAALILAGASIAATPVSATADNTADWVATANVTVPNSTTVHFAVPNDGDSGYLYNVNLDHAVHAGDVVSFHMDTQNGTYCTDFYPFVYVVIDGRGFSSFQDGTPCPGNTTWTQDDGNVDFTVSEDGTISYIVVAYYDGDQDGTGGVAEISDLQINGQQILFAPNPPPPPPCQGSNCPHVATAYGSALTHKYGRCRIKTFSFLDQAQKGQYADPQKRKFITRVDGRVHDRQTVKAGGETRSWFHTKPNVGKRIVTVRTSDGQLMDRMKFRSGRC